MVYHNDECNDHNYTIIWSVKQIQNMQGKSRMQIPVVFRTENKNKLSSCIPGKWGCFLHPPYNKVREYGLKTSNKFIYVLMQIINYHNII